jgi:hypothetical protein
MAAAWPSIWNANRNVFPGEPASTTAVPAGTCLYVPAEWFTSSWNRSKYTRPNQCIGRRAYVPLSQGRIDELGIAQARTGICGQPTSRLIALCFTRSQLYSVTQASLGGAARRPRTPTADQWRAISARMRSVNDLARSFLSRGNTPSVLVGPDIMLVNDRLPYCLPSTTGTCVARTKYDHPRFCLVEFCTVGRYVFATTGLSPDRVIKAHEYIHVLQYEAYGMDFYTKYADYLGGLISAVANPPNNVMEAPAYLWSGWTWALGYVEREPWQIWVRPPSGGPFPL